MGRGFTRRELRMKCTICGHATLPGAMLCGPCRAALKRARYLSVQVISPSTMMPGRPRRSRAKVAALAAPLAAPLASPNTTKVLAAQAAATASVAPVAAVSRRRLQALAIGVIAVLALGVVAYFGQSPARDAAFMAPPAAPARVTAVTARPASVAAVAPQDATSSGRAATSVLVSSSPADEAPQPAARTRVSRAAAPAPGRAAVAAMVATGPGAESYEMVPEPPRPVALAPAPEPAPPPPPDRWQVMRDNLARCDREGGLGGFICDQRVRLDACEGYWGRVPQCPLPPENPR